jgi:iron complex transport system ATP-binding protein
VIAASDISFAYGGTAVLSGVELLAREGEVVGLIGPNGSGKTTLLGILYAALQPRAGLVAVDDVPLESLSPLDVARRIAVVAQEAPPELPLTVGEMVLLGRMPHRSVFEGYADEDYRLAAAALTRVGARELARRSFSQLSGGEKQRVLIARAIAQQGDHLLLDEPTNHLDIRHQHGVLELVRGLGVTTIVVLHDLNLAARYCDRLLLLRDGEIVASGPPEDVLTPEVLEPIYGVCVRRMSESDCVQLIFSPERPPSAAVPEPVASRGPS